MQKMQKTAWMSNGLNTVRKFRNVHTIPIMQNKGSNEIIYKRVPSIKQRLYSK
jgi:hypothetical protein